MSTRLRATVATLVGMACLAPFVVLALMSVAGSWEFPNLLPAGWRFDRWVGVAASGNALASSLGVSLLISTSVALVASAAGFLTARAIADHRRRPLLMLAAYLPFAASPVIFGVCLLYFYIRLGIVATIAGVVLSHTIFAYAFAVVLLVPFWNAEKRGYEDLVRTLGGSRLYAYRHVVLPMSKGPLLVCFFQTFLISWFQYGLTLLVGAGKVDTLPLRVYAYVSEANLGYAAVAGGLLMLPPVILSVVNRRVVRRLA